MSSSSDESHSDSDGEAQDYYDESSDTDLSAEATPADKEKLLQLLSSMPHLLDFNQVDEPSKTIQDLQDQQIPLSVPTTPNLEKQTDDKYQDVKSKKTSSLSRSFGKDRARTRLPVPSSSLSVINVRDLLGNCVHEGSLALLEGKSWKWSWFILSPALLLYHFKDLNDESPQGVISLKDYQRVKEMNRAWYATTKPNRKVVFFFQLQKDNNKDESLSFCSDSLVDYQRWLKILHEQLTIVGPNSDRSSDRSRSILFMSAPPHQSVIANNNNNNNNMNINNSNSLHIQPGLPSPASSDLLLKSPARDTNLQSSSNSSPLTLPVSQSNGLQIRWVLYCHVAEARNLFAANPYVVLNFAGNQKRTPTARKSSGKNRLKDSFWGEDCQFVLNYSEEKRFDRREKSLLRVSVFDQLANAKDEFLGETEVDLAITLADHKLHEEWMPLLKSNQCYVAGKVRLKLFFRKPHEGIGGSGTLLVKVIEARDLAARDANGLSDPYVVLSLGKQNFKTKVVKKNLNPIYNIEYVFEVSSKDISLKVEMRDWDKVGTHLFMGLVEIGLDCLEEGVHHDDWYLLGPKSSGSALRDSMRDSQYNSPVMSPPSSSFISSENSLGSGGKKVSGKKERKKTGDIRLKLQWTIERILPLVKYERLVNMLFEEDFKWVHEIARLPGDKEGIATCLCKIFHASDKIVDLISFVTTEEINSQTEPEVLFRSNTLGTKLVDAYQKMVGSQYLKNVISPLVLPLYNDKKSYEVDPTKIDKTESLERNTSQLLLILNQLLNSIFSSATQIPSSIKTIYKNLRESAINRFPDHQDVQYTVLSSFFFLRLVCPCIMNPKLFHLTPDHPSDQTARTFTLAAKSVQTLANLNLFGVKEAYMTPFNEFFIQPNLDSMKLFLSLISVPDQEQYVVPEIEIYVERELSVLHVYLEQNRQNLLVDQDGSKMTKTTCDLIKIIDELNAVQSTFLASQIKSTFDLDLASLSQTNSSDNIEANNPRNGHTP
eukprot:TRINITY_DN12286_c0_g1_i1.p1 TRINITY_DN12286_c0_g1~~TRINITY_DN12286_c0_g1_i1.p1  ORF type:complete len:996 (-),score=232.04 TRINITY_DN12286_c0_g1_i1:187-3174(-)